MEFPAYAKCRVKTEFRRVFLLNVDTGQCGELAPKTVHRTHAREQMKHMHAVYVPLYLVQLERRSTLLHALVRRVWRSSGAWTLFTATRFNQSLIVELDNRSPRNLSITSCASRIFPNLGLLPRKSISQSFWSVVKTRTVFCFFKAGPNHGG